MTRGARHGRGSGSSLREVSARGRGMAAILPMTVDGSALRAPALTDEAPRFFEQSDSSRMSSSRRSAVGGSESRPVRPGIAVPGRRRRVLVQRVELRAPRVIGRQGCRHLSQVVTSAEEGPGVGENGPGDLLGALLAEVSGLAAPRRAEAACRVQLLLRELEERRDALRSAHTPAAPSARRVAMGWSGRGARSSSSAARHGTTFAPDARAETGAYAASCVSSASGASSSKTTRRSKSLSGRARPSARLPNRSIACGRNARASLSTRARSAASSSAWGPTLGRGASCAGGSACMPKVTTAHLPGAAPASASARSRVEAPRPAGGTRSPR